MKVLMVEDEKRFAEAVTSVLSKNNYSVDNAYDGEYGLDCALSGIYDFIILDIMLPKMDGLQVLQELRREGIETPVLMLTARGEIGDKVTGLDCGADDYLPKPFHMDELLARLRALGRRKGELHVDGLVKFGELTLNPHKLTLEKGDTIVTLTLKESQLLDLLISRCDSYVSKDVIIEKLWSYDADVSDNQVESQVSLLRKKLAAVKSTHVIRASRGIGYRIGDCESRNLIEN